MKRTVLAILAAGGALACSDPAGTPTGPGQAAAPEPSAAFSPLGPSFATTVASTVVAPIFGPVDCVQKTRREVEVRFSFDGTAGNSAKLIVTDNGVAGLNGKVEFNRRTVVRNRMLRGKQPVADTIPITLRAHNRLVCQLEGKAGTGLTLSVVQ
jgi:hypothetical protein